MRIICPNCSSQYDVDASLFPEEGREVQCAQCQNKWVQYPAPPEPVAAPKPAPKPSEVLPEIDRDAIRAAVQEEMEIADREVPDLPEQEEIEVKAEEEELMQSLREQLAEDDVDYDSEPDDDRVSGRRSVARAADIVGVGVTDDAIDDERSNSKAGAATESAKPNALAAALQEYERERGPRRGSRFGFVVAILLSGAAAGAYFGRNEIATYYPPALPYLEQYVGIVDQSRDKVVELWNTTTVFLTEKIEEAMAPDEEA